MLFNTKIFFVTQCLKSFENIAIFLLEPAKENEYLIYPFDLANIFYAAWLRRWTKSSNAPRNIFAKYSV